MLHDIIKRRSGLRAPAKVAIGSNVQVPAGFIGLHLHRYPVNPDGGAVDPAPTFAFGTYRTHDSGLSWWAGNPSNGVYDWTLHDTLINHHAAAGRSIVYTLFRTPTWAARSGLAGYTGPYGGLGECAPPQNNTTIAAFVTALMNRYNGGATKKIQCIELWNEPNFDQTHTGFYWGSAADLVATSAAVRAAAKAVDPTVQILSPGFEGRKWLLPWLTAVDAASGTLNGVDLIDGVSLHPYNASHEGTYSVLSRRVGTSLAQARADVAASGGSASIPMYLTEYGGPSEFGGFASLSAQQRYLALWRMLAFSAASGAKMLGLFSFNSGYVGDLTGDTQGVIAAIQDFAAAVPGKTISSSYLSQSGAVSLMIDGVEVAR